MGKGRKITRALRWTYWVFRWRRSARLLQHASDVACWRCRRALSSKTSAYSSCASTHEFLCPQYAPKNRQTRSLCSAPPQSVCDSTFGLSIARGSFEFSRGAWTHVRQTVVLNSSGVQDGGFLLEVNGDRVIDRVDVFYRDKPREPDFIPTPSYDPDPRVGRKRGLLGRLLDRLIKSIKSRPGLRGDDSRELSSQVPSDPSSGFVPSIPCNAADANAQTDPASTRWVGLMPISRYPALKY